MRLWVFLLALFALSATILAQDYEGEEEAPIADSDGASDVDNQEEVPEANEGDEEEVEAGGEEIESPTGASEVVPEDDAAPVEENEGIPDDADEAHVEENEGATEEQLLANENVGEEIQINEAQAEELQSEDDWGVQASPGQKRNASEQPQWKHYPLYSGSIDVDRDCGCKIKWMKKVYRRPKCKPTFYHFHKSVGFRNNHHHHHCRRVVPFPRRAHVHHVVRHHVHHKKPCGCLKKTIIKNVVVHHRKPKPCKGKNGYHGHHGHGRQWRFRLNDYKH